MKVPLHLLKHNSGSEKEVGKSPVNIDLTVKSNKSAVRAEDTGNARIVATHDIHAERTFDNVKDMIEELRTERALAHEYQEKNLDRLLEITERLKP